MIFCYCNEETCPTLIITAQPIWGMHCPCRELLYNTYLDLVKFTLQRTLFIYCNLPSLMPRTPSLWRPGSWSRSDPSMSTALFLCLLWFQTHHRPLPPKLRLVHCWGRCLDESWNSPLAAWVWTCPPLPQNTHVCCAGSLIGYRSSRTPPRCRSLCDINNMKHVRE